MDTTKHNTHKIIDDIYWFDWLGHHINVEQALTKENISKVVKMTDVFHGMGLGVLMDYDLDGWKCGISLYSPATSLSDSDPECLKNLPKEEWEHRIILMKVFAHNYLISYHTDYPFSFLDDLPDNSQEIELFFENRLKTLLLEAKSSIKKQESHL